MLRASVLSSLLLCSACGFGHDVEQDGSYAIVPGARVDDSALLPLERLLIIEQDLSLGQTRVYYFSGDLHAADLGMEDLRRIAARHGNFQMSFDARRERVDLAEIEGHGRSRRAHAGDDEIELVRLDTEGLREVHALRFLSSLSSADYDVAAYFGVIDGEDPLPELSIERTDVSYRPRIPSPELGIEATDEQLLALDYRVDADYLVVELAQPIQSHEDERELDALVRTSLAPGSPYVVTPALLTDVTSQGCWSRDRALELRLHQVVRAYRPAQAWAVIHDRIDTLELAPETWTSLLSEPEPRPYCDEFE